MNKLFTALLIICIAAIFIGRTMRIMHWPYCKVVYFGGATGALICGVIIIVNLSRSKRD